MAYNENRRKNLFIRDAKLLFKNFSGEETQYNRRGDRNFSVLIDDPDQAELLIREGWNLKPLRKKDEQEEQRYHLPVAVRYDNFPPQVTMRRAGRPNLEMDEDNIGQLDYADICNCHLTLNPSRWEVNGKSGIKAYLKGMIVDIEEDELQAILAEEAEEYC